MAEQLYWEDIEVDSEVTPLAKVATTLMLIKWAGGGGDFNPLHFDEPFAKASGVSRPVVQGLLKHQWLVQLMTSWIGEEGTLRKISCQYRGFDYPRLMKTGREPHEGETWWCKGKVTKKYAEGDEHLVDCDIWIENGKGEVTTPGKSTVALPSKG